jgi:23S rRNA (cytosine1962-C5)-methyltransferase
MPAQPSSTIDWPLATLLERAIAARSALFEEQQIGAFRLLNGFYEGIPSLVVDLYGKTLVLYNYADDPAGNQDELKSAQRFLHARLSWVEALILKTRRGATPQEKRGIVLYGKRVDDRVCEHGVWYALDLLMNQDASIYLDTRNLRKWAIEKLRGKTVLNTFAYTGSLGVAALAGGAARVVHLDRNRKFLNVAKTSYTLNGFPIRKQDFRIGDFFPLVSRLKRAGERFDCVLLDPPFFSVTKHGTVDQAKHSVRLINKVRPLIEDGGCLVAINNALFLSGKDYMQMLESLCADGYLHIEALIPVPEDFTGYAHTRVENPPVDPAPFNHSTKIAVLRVRRKS